MTEQDTFFSNVAEKRWFGADSSMMPREVAERSQPAQLARVVGLRPTTTIATAALATLRSGRASRATVEQIVRTDVAFALKVVRHACTVDPSRKVSTLDDAIRVVGPRMLPGLVAAVATETAVVDEDGENHRIRLHGLGVAILARTIARAASVPAPDELYLIGLVHDLGRLLRLQAGQAAGNDDPAAEMVRHGYDHAVLGSQVLATWRLPASIHRVVALHHHPGKAFGAGAEMARRVACVAVADRIEPVLAAHGQVEDAFHALRSGTALHEYLGMDAGGLLRVWPLLVKAYQESIELYPEMPRPEGGE